MCLAIVDIWIDFLRPFCAKNLKLPKIQTCADL